MFTKGVFDDLPVIAADELDFPHKSAYTGFNPDSEELPIRSIYKYMLERNRCNKTDY